MNVTTLQVAARLRSRFRSFMNNYIPSLLPFPSMIVICLFRSRNGRGSACERFTGALHFLPLLIRSLIYLSFRSNGVGHRRNSDLH